ncbi:alpha/beta hydrolase [Sphingosinicella sp. LHD-64]|uniref:alpha/beta hydrolase n=1 Tax=Sphingosinicella sp. LHD-64 TaxID=3072139 RepID=UPI00281011E1|nr:alpha/beta hydrolase [Sphingosinicella sp. LHD-64]MDQ8756333.1 alpha/beta hydrolase [Sphingosinicella sp. LHD-64]
MIAHRLLIVIAALLASSAPAFAELAPPAERLGLSSCQIAVRGPDGAETGEQVTARCGTLRVPENREVTDGRVLALNVVVLPARNLPGREPVYFISGGPGQAATVDAPGFADARYRDTRDIVLMDIRGTGGDNALECALGGSDDNVQAYLEPLLADGVRYAECRDQLAQRADLTQYTTPKAMEDLDELRQALGHDRILIDSGSYGTRAALTYIRMFGSHVRAAALSGAAPIENRLPLYHAAAAQRAFDLIVESCVADPACAAAYPDVRGDLAAILARLGAAPVMVRIPHPATNAPVEVRLTASAFGDGLRVILYGDNALQVPLLLKRGRAGDLAPFAEAAMQGSRGLRRAVRTGLMLSISCAEDVWRIRPEEVARLTEGSFIGAYRVRGQMAACSVWPRGQVSDDYYRQMRSDVPVLILSGQFDPVTPPSWGAAMARNFSRPLHVVVPAGHVPVNDCTQSLTRQLFDRGSTEGIDTSCVAAMRRPAFALPNAPAEAIGS